MLPYFFLPWICFELFSVLFLEFVSDFFLLMYCFVFMPLDWFIRLHVKFSVICVILSMFLGCSFCIVWLLKETCRTEFKDIPIKFSTCFFLLSFLLAYKLGLPCILVSYLKKLVVDSIFFWFKVTCLWNKLLIF